MNTSPQNPDSGSVTRHSSRSALLLLALTAALLVLGCQSFSWNLLSRNARPDDKAQVNEPIQHPEGAPTKYALRIPPYVFLSDRELRKDETPFPELAGLRDQLNHELALSSGITVIQVYLFEDRPRYDRFIQARYPTLPPRRAFFVSQPRALSGSDDLLVYASWNDRIQQDLRHELTHALLHSVIGQGVPIWFDEGLAEYFELPPDRKGVNAAHVLELKRNFKPDLPRLEELKEVDQMKAAEYRESWAWIHFMLNTTPEARTALLSYLRDLRTSPNPVPLSARLDKVIPNVEDALLVHLAGLDTRQSPPRSVAGP
jgi:hypothetical protein